MLRAVTLLFVGLLGLDQGTLHAPLNDLLEAHVKDGVVDYAGLKKKEADLDKYLLALAQTGIAKFDRAEKIAFWINAYNAFTLKLMLKNYPGVKSIRDLKKPWGTREWRAAGSVYTLDDIEHKILRKVFKEPRVHFVLVCASKSCPDLPPHAFTAGKLEEQLSAAARGFLGNRKKGLKTFDDDGDHVVALSKIFKWYGDDFEVGGREVIDYLLPYLTEKDRAFVKRHRDDLDIRYLDYDWSLNGR